VVATWRPPDLVPELPETRRATSIPSPGRVGAIVLAVAGLGIAGLVVGTSARTDDSEVRVDLDDVGFPLPTVASEEAVSRPPGPLVVGASWGLGPLMVTLDAVELDADATIAAVNQFNAPPAPGAQLVLVTMSFDNTSTDDAVVFAELQLEVVDAQGRPHNSFGARVLPTPLPLDPIGPGATVTGQLAFEVPIDGLDGAVLAVSAWDELGAPAVEWRLE
jgi:hypothetical protein